MSDETQYEIDELQRKVTELTQASNYAEAIEMLLRIHNSNNKREKSIKDKQ